MPDKDSGLLSGEEIRNQGLIVDASEARFRASTYDLSIGEIVPSGKESPTLPANGEYRLAPGGTIRVIARESLKLPDNITGQALPRNTLCTRGVLAINIGIIDPGFDGPISSTLINFGAADFVLRPGMPFLRASFHRCPASPKAAHSERWDREAYVEQVREQVLAYSAPTFLNLEETVSRAGERAFGKFKEYLLIWVAVAAAALALITVFVPLGASYVDRYLTSREKWEEQAERTIQQKLDDRDAARFKDLTDQVAELRRALVSKKPATQAVTGANNSRQ